MRFPLKPTPIFSRLSIIVFAVLACLDIVMCFPVYGAYDARIATTIQLAHNAVFSFWVIPWLAADRDSQMGKILSIFMAFAIWGVATCSVVFIDFSRQKEQIYADNLNRLKSLTHGQIPDGCVQMNLLERRGKWICTGSPDQLRNFFRQALGSEWKEMAMRDGREIAMVRPSTTDHGKVDEIVIYPYGPRPVFRVRTSVTPYIPNS